ncbi:hypothetical protein BC937DRAFT_92954 [Endogone sp. FLAS-F59071]|nr:hypothetical protein BC937DRAFT_92954 [Endogone sp. FLAS-F59071]|eukprot:RUS15059.1 hypothetical protein BC937DRAFT_92954 [Endogone sp. FLAS-F59071]
MDSYKDQVAALETKNQELIREKNRLDYDVKHLAAKVDGLETERMGYTEHIQSLEERQKRHKVEEQGHELDSTLNSPINILFPSPLPGVGLDPFFQPRTSITRDDDDDDDNFGLGNNLEDALNDTNTRTLKLRIGDLERQIKTLQEERSDSTGGHRAIVLEHQLEDANRLKAKFEKNYVDAATERDILEADMKRIGGDISAALQNTNSPIALRARIVDLEKELRERIVEMEGKVQTGIGATTTTDITASSGVPIAPPDISEHASISELREQIRQQNEQIRKLMLEKDHLQTQQIEDKNRLLDMEKNNNQLKSNLVDLKSVGGDEVLRLLREENANLQKQHNEMQIKMQKAKEFIKQQDKLFKETKANQSKDNTYEEAVKSLQAEVESKSKENENLKKQIHEVRLQSRREQQLILSAWNDLGRRLQLQRDNVSSRSPSSWLAQQRQTLGKQMKRG